MRCSTTGTAASPAILAPICMPPRASLPALHELHDRDTPGLASHTYAHCTHDLIGGRRDDRELRSGVEQESPGDEAAVLAQDDIEEGQRRKISINSWILLASILFVPSYILVV